MAVIATGPSRLSGQSLESRGCPVGHLFQPGGPSQPLRIQAARKSPEEWVPGIADCPGWNVARGSLPALW